MSNSPTMQACDSCHRRKSRCDKSKPACADCERRGFECTYTNQSKDPSVRKENVENLERRLRQCEAKNTALANENAALRNAASKSRADPIASHIESQPSKDDSGDVINEVSFLATTAAGERPYLGSTSGILFAKLVRAGVNIKPNSCQPMGSPVRELGFLSSTSPPFGTNLAETLPSKSLARELFKNYFAHDHVCYPFLLPSSTMSLVESMYEDPNFHGKNPVEAFIFDMILAIATVNIYKFDWQMLPSAEAHHARAMLQITEVLQAGGLASLQAILLMCQYRISSSIQDTSGSMWHLIGIAVRIAFELGLHRESAYSLKAGLDSEGDKIAELRDQEVRRRCFWCVLTLDRIVSITLGRPLAIHTEDIDVELPLAENNHIIDSGLEAGAENDTYLNRTLIFIQITKYRLLCGKIMRALHGPKRQGHDDIDMRRLRDDLATELDDWQRNTKDLGLPDFELCSAVPQKRTCFQSKEWYGVLYHNAVLMLFRPSPGLSEISGDSLTLERLFQSSKQAVALYSQLHRSRKLNYSWITLHAVFMAGLTYLYALSRHFRERRRNPRNGAFLQSDPSAIEIVNDTRACSNLLVAVSERWNALRHGHEVFDKLSDAVLADAISLQCTTSAGMQRTPILPPQQDSITVIPRLQPPLPNTNGLSPRPYMHPEIGNEYATWAQNDDGGAATNFYSGTSPLAIDSQFRNCFGDLEHLYNGSGVNDPVMDLTHDWLGYLNGSDSHPNQNDTFG